MLLWLQGVIFKCLKWLGRFPNNSTATQAKASCLSELVFHNQLILDKILNFALYNEDKVDMKTANSCKLVQRLWLYRVNALLQRAQPLSPILLDLSRGDRNTNIQFLHTFGDLPPERIPPYNLSISITRDSNMTSISDEEILFGECLTRCGTGIQKLRLLLFDEVWDGDEGPDIFTSTHDQFQLPQLTKLELMDYRRTRDSDERTNLFVQRLLRSCPNLKTLFIYENPRFYVYAALQFKNLLLPRSIREISLSGCAEAASRWENLFLHNELPNLVNLSLKGEMIVPDCDFNHQVFRIVNHFRSQLRILSIADQTFISRQIVTLPVMDVLENFDCTNLGCQLTEDSLKLETHMPSLKNITLRGLTFEQLSQILDDSTMTSVERVNAGFRGELTLDEPPQDVLLLQQMNMLKLAFPNVLNLTVKLPVTQEMSAVKLIFEEMRQLQEFSLEVEGDMKYYSFFSLLLGNTTREAHALIREGHFQNIANMNCEDKPTSVVNMQELKKLRLSAYVTTSRRNVVVTITDAVFQATFFRMPNLRDLTLEKLTRLHPSAQVVQRWRAEGRSINMEGARLS